MPENEDQNEKEEIELIADEETDTSALLVKVKKTKEELKKCDKERNDYLEGWQRAKADFINLRKEEGKRFEDLGRFVTASLLQELLPVLDSFDLALSHDLPRNTTSTVAKGDTHEVVEVDIRGLPKETERGVILIRSQFEDTLKKRGLAPINAAMGEQFNPERHESVGEIESEHPAGTIAEVVQKGYMFQGRVLRPVRVRIAKNIEQ